MARIGLSDHEEPGRRPVSALPARDDRRRHVRDRLCRAPHCQGRRGCAVTDLRRPALTRSARVPRIARCVAPHRAAGLEKAPFGRRRRRRAV